MLFSFGAKLHAPFCLSTLTMEQPRIAENARDRTRRPVRTKRYNRQTYSEDRRPPKRLFTPEIKRFLKDWLIRRRDNPYPNRDEKKTLAVQTGLTYIQVCNWFANWRRKLKNSGKLSHRKSWGHLIKTYNNQVHGNVEHFSICSEDSIWHELEAQESRNDLEMSGALDFDETCLHTSPLFVYGPKKEEYLRKSNNNVISEDEVAERHPNPFVQSKYKNQIIEKYLRDCQKPEETGNERKDDERSSMISKWLESAVNFKPSENSYLGWTLGKSEKKVKTKKPTRNGNRSNFLVQKHGKEEIDAAVALTALANAHSTI